MKMPKWLGTLVLLSTLQFEQIKIVKSWLILLCWIRIRIRILNADPDPDPADQNRCGSVRIRIRIRIRIHITEILTNFYWLIGNEFATFLCYYQWHPFTIASMEILASCYWLVGNGFANFVMLLPVAPFHYCLNGNIGKPLLVNWDWICHHHSAIARGTILLL